MAINNAELIRGHNTLNQFGGVGRDGYLNYFRNSGIPGNPGVRSRGNYFRESALGGNFDFLDQYRILAQNVRAGQMGDMMSDAGLVDDGSPLATLVRYGNLLSGLGAQNRSYGQEDRDPEMAQGNLAIMKELRRRIKNLRGVGGNGPGNGPATTGPTTTPQVPPIPTTPVPNTPTVPSLGQPPRTPQSPPTAGSRAPIRAPGPPTSTPPTRAPVRADYQLPGPPEIPDVTLPDPTRSTATEGLWLSRKASNPLTRLHDEWSRGNPEWRRLNEAMDGDFARMLFRG